MAKAKETHNEVDTEVDEEIKKDEEWLKIIMNQFETNNQRSRVVFLSSKSRTYFPQDPGSSRFGIAYAMNCAPGDVPNPQYTPSENRLEKPVSNKGYGIGGLSSSRFAKDLHESNPAPNAYQDWVAVPLPRKKSKSKKRTTKKSGFAGDGAANEEFRKSESDALQERHHLGSHALMTKAQLRNLCLQSFIGFGSQLKVDRFGNEPKFHAVGVGYYDLRRKTGEIRKACSFGQDPVRLIPPTVTRCNYKEHDKCFECDELLRTVDYYRTLKKIKNPFYNINPSDRSEDLDRLYFKDSSAADHLNHRKVFVSLCRRCYCRGMRGESNFWVPANMSKMFSKTRHCSYIHDHRNLQIFTNKADPTLMCKLRKKEIFMSKYYKDACDSIVKNK